MQRAVCLILSTIIAASSFSQNKKPATPQKAPAVKPVTTKILKDLRDSASYTAGIYIVNKYRSQNIYNFNSAVCAKAVSDLQTGKPQMITDSEADEVVLKYQQKLLAGSQPVTSPAPAAVALKDVRDSASYAAGIHLVTSLRDFDITNFNTTIIAKAIDDLQNKKPSLLNDSLANASMIKYQQRLQEVKNKPNIDAGKKFLAENKKRAEVKATKSGLQYEVIKQGTGPVPTKNDKVSCHYIGSFIDGKEFENSYKTGNPISFSVTGVIKGWTEALQMMPVGSRWKLFIPYHLAYGPGQYHSIPGGSVLIFELELLGTASN